jgi:hypothetical protein
MKTSPNAVDFCERAYARIARIAKKARRKADAPMDPDTDAVPGLARLHGYTRGYAAGLEKALELLETTPYEAPARRERKPARRERKAVAS